MKLNRSRLLIAALVIPVALIAATPSPALATGASVVVGTMSGHGSFSPGLTLNPAGSFFSFTGTATVSGVVHGTPVVMGIYGITASGVDIVGSLGAGAGPIIVNIASYGSQFGYFVREGMRMHVPVIEPRPFGGNSSVIIGEFVIRYDQPAAPVTNFLVTGTFSLAANY